MPAGLSDITMIDFEHFDSSALAEGSVGETPTEATGTVALPRSPGSRIERERENMPLHIEGGFVICGGLSLD
jgi:hypothetical protein